MSHTFHIPVLGLGFSIDTPLKVARYGISSTMSIVYDELIERMRQYHARLNGEDFVPVHKKDEDARTRRITLYLDLVDRHGDGRAAVHHGMFTKKDGFSGSAPAKGWHFSPYDVKNKHDDQPTGQHRGL